MQTAADMRKKGEETYCRWLRLNRRKKEREGKLQLMWGEGEKRCALWVVKDKPQKEERQAVGNIRGCKKAEPQKKEGKGKLQLM